MDTPPKFKPESQVFVKKTVAFTQEQFEFMTERGKKYGSANEYLRKLIEDDKERQIALERDYRH